MPLLWCVGNSACLFIMSGMEATETKVERTHSLMSQWNFKMNAIKTYFSLFRSECSEGGCKHTQTRASGNPVFFLHFLSVCWVCLHGPVTSPPRTDRERWIVWEEDGSLVNAIILPSL